MVILHCVRTCSEQLWWWYCTVSEHVANSCDGDTALSEHVVNSCDGDTALSEHVVKVINRILTAVMWSSVDSIQYAVCYMAVWMFTALSACLFSRRNTVDAADCCGMFGDERGRHCCSLCCHIMSVFSVCPWIQHFSLLMYQCTLWCVAALTRQHIITSSAFKFCTSLTDITWLFTHYLFCFLIYNNIAPEDIQRISVNCLFCIIMKCP